MTGMVDSIFCDVIQLVGLFFIIPANNNLTRERDGVQLNNNGYKI